MKKVKITKLTVILTSVIVASLLYVFALVPFFRMWNDLARRMEVVDLQYARDMARVENFDAYRNEYKQIEAIGVKNRSDEEERALFLKEIESFIQGLSISLKDIKPLKTQDKKGSETFYLELEMESSIGDLMAYLHTIATSGSLIRVERMTISTKEKKSNIHIIKQTVSKTFAV